MFEEKVAQKLKSEFSFLSMKNSLSVDCLKCLTYLTKKYLGTSRKDIFYFYYFA